MKAHAQIAVAADCEIYFCDPHSPRQRGTNENTNGLLRQYFPKGTPLAGHSPAHLAAVADELNGRPRKTLGWKTRVRRWQRSWTRTRQPDRSYRWRLTPPLISSGVPRSVRGRPSGLQATAHRLRRRPCGPAWTPETTAAPGRQQYGPGHGLPPQRATPRHVVRRHVS